MGRAWPKTMLRAVWTLSLLATTWVSSYGQEQGPSDVKAALDTQSFNHVSPIVFSKNGKWLAFAVRGNKRMRAREVSGIEREIYVRTGIMTEDEASNIWVSNVETGESRNLTGGKYSNWNPSWSPDGRYLGFLSDRDGSGQARLWIWDTVKDDLWEVAGVNIRSAYLSPGIQWTPDSRSVLITIVPSPLTTEEYAQRILYPAGSGESAGAKIPGTTAILYRAHRTDPGDVAAARASRVNLDAYSLADLVLIDVETGKLTAIASGHRVGWYSVSPDGSYIAYAVPTRLHPEGRFRKQFDLFVMDRATRGEHQLLSEALLTDVFAWKPGGSLLLFGVYEKDGARFFAASPRAWAVRPLGVLPRSPAPYEMPVWDPRENCFYVLADGALWKLSASDADVKEVVRIPDRRIVRKTVQPVGTLWTNETGAATVVITQDDARKQSGFYKADLETGQSAKLLEEGHCYDCNAMGSGLGLHVVAASGLRVAYIAEDAGHAPDLWVSDFDFRRPRRLTNLNPQFEDSRMGTGMLVDWLDGDGVRLRGAVLLPSNYRKGETYPLLVFVYPAQLSSNLDRFAFGNFPGPFNLQLFATRGYVVFLPDVREGARSEISGLAKSVLPGIDKLVEMGLADPERVGIMGHSMGGYATLALLVQSDRFKAAVEVAGFADFAELFGQMDPDGASWSADEVEQLMGGPPWGQPLRYVSNSPIYSLDKITTPLLIVQGSEDESVSSFAADGIFVGLRRLGREVEYARYERESHEPRNWDYANQRDLCLRVLEWFESHLKANASPQQNGVGN